jgi:hypothetical protein
MGDIYSKALKAIAWLGPENPLFVEGLRASGEDWVTFYQDLIRNRDGTHQSMTDDGPCLTMKATRASHGEMLIPWTLEDYFAPVLDLLNNKYWSRIWIVQEIVLDVALRVCCGTSRIEDYTLRVVIHNLRATTNDAAPKSCTMICLNRAERVNRNARPNRISASPNSAILYGIGSH